MRGYGTGVPQLVGSQPSIRGPMRPFTSGVVGFLAGFSLAGTLGLYYLQREYRAASSSVLASSARLTSSAQNVTSYLERITAVEEVVNQLNKQVVKRDEFSQAAQSMRKLYSDLFEETHELRKRMWELGTYIIEVLTQNMRILQRANDKNQSHGHLQSRKRPDYPPSA
ncbi:hypothetical protein MPSI1_001928 [Malassezia psittaci]|uniref:Uncharacterized protein n=1 Tax=Malassezia psittaci TaxID=1821823 RepID=A0AAF0FEL8_9BASI|nr:hypothetical protein MPSI1_001928 [Malassezia psittaci]